jgi:hypothetical protein
MIDEETIALVSTDELIKELKSRHPNGAIIALQNPPHEARSSKKDWRISFIGEKTTTLKLANIAVWMHQQEFMGGMNDDSIKA